ncbi:NAD-dependent epimerase/dehydratase family protein [Halomarina oriensis]|uniref:NAD-dependent epimerase/dehydratase family protein n=1 Tax=Halomarina oriensis TaxID=671145 RepID=A0A6B0GG79_9EURY|nr:NAD-dependent epimerase/dehydratase family protein [Halomarina oriensis]MWG33822.1 NAD-dependent epimerase/dehydratase family protein [Halomarina oriensis]
MTQPDLGAIETEAQLTDALTAPYPEDVEFAKRLDGDVMILGAAGKMGPSLAGRILRASDRADVDRTVYAVSRFSDSETREVLDSHGAETIAADLLSEESLAALPDCKNVIYMVGTKFGTGGREPQTWAINAYLPGDIARRFENSRIVAFSTGNVYPPVLVESGGPTEDDETGPVGEYAQSCLGRERVFQYFSEENDTPVCLFRLNYAVEARYGVLTDIAKWVRDGDPVPLDMGYVNVVWQGDANSVCFRSLEFADSPAKPLNVTGPEILSVRDIAERFADRFDTDVRFDGEEHETALLSDASRCHERYGEPKVSVDEVVDLVASWVEADRPMMDKPTKFHVRSGEF